MEDHSQAEGSSLPVREPKAGRAASPPESVAPLQDSASQDSLTTFSATGTGRSIGFGTSDRRDLRSEVISRKLRCECCRVAGRSLQSVVEYADVVAVADRGATFCAPRRWLVYSPRWEDAFSTEPNSVARS